MFIIFTIYLSEHLQHVKSAFLDVIGTNMFICRFSVVLQITFIVPLFYNIERLKIICDFGTLYPV